MKNWYVNSTNIEEIVRYIGEIVRYIGEINGIFVKSQYASRSLQWDNRLRKSLFLLL